jgi:hypothetical protein
MPQAQSPDTGDGLGWGRFSVYLPQLVQTAVVAKNADEKSRRSARLSAWRSGRRRVQARFIVIDENGSRDVHGVDQHETLLDTAFPEAVFHLPCDVEERSPAGDLKSQFFAK